MTSIDQTTALLSAFRNEATETISLARSLGRTLSHDVVSSVRIPAFDKSAMDGYACDFSDIGKPLHCIGTAQAGKAFNAAIAAGQCVKIMTGAPVPTGANGVFMYEDATILPNGMILCVAANPKRNICSAGEDIGIGDVVLPQGTFIEPHHIAALASIGAVEVTVFRSYSVGIIATGTELVEVGQAASAAQIVNTNSPMLCAKLPEAQYYGIVPDVASDLRSAIEKMMLDHQVIIITGGASDSEFDLVPQVIHELGFETIIRKVSMQPGKPFLFAHKHNHRFCFGLSGNPVSAYIQLLLFVEPFLRSAHPMHTYLPIATDYLRKKADRDQLVPVGITREGAVPIANNGSAHIAAFAQAWGLMQVPQGVTSITKGELVYVRSI